MPSTSFAVHTALPSLAKSRKTSLAAGIVYLLTFVSIPTFFLYAPLLEARYIGTTTEAKMVTIGALLEIIVGITGIATAVILYPVLSRQHRASAMGLVASRVLEAATIFTGVAFLLATVSLQQQTAGAETRVVSTALVSLYNRIFLLGQSFMPAINDLLLGYMLWQSRLVPRALSLIGMVGAVPLIAGYLAVLFGFIDQRSPMAGLSALLVAVFEFSLGIYLIVKGFRSVPESEERELAVMTN
jgi:Domain of unknown function (DUF4386)